MGIIAKTGASGIFWTIILPTYSKNQNLIESQTKPIWIRLHALAWLLADHYRGILQQAEQGLLEVLPVRPESERKQRIEKYLCKVNPSPVFSRWKWKWEEIG
jgi:hypothetical protein